MDQVLALLENPQARKFLIIFIFSLIILLVSRGLKALIPKYIQETNQRYRTRKYVSYTAYIIIILFILITFSAKLSGVTVFLGVAGAGIAFALQEIIVSVAGFMAINFSHFYSVGDRVMLGGIKGDVIDIGLLRTSLMQVGDWVNGDLYNGKMVRVANSFIFKEPVFNYSGEFPFLWDEVIIPLKTESDYHLAKKEFLKILNEVQGDYAREAVGDWQKMTEKMMIEDARVEPMVHMSFDENWISFVLRYVVDYKKRRSTKDQIYSKCLDLINASEGKLKVASASMEITSFPTNN